MQTADEAFVKAAPTRKLHVRFHCVRAWMLLCYCGAKLDVLYYITCNEVCMLVEIFTYAGQHTTNVTR